MTLELGVDGALSQVLIALTIEMDNEFEHRMPHRTSENRGDSTTPGDKAARPWLTSFVMTANFLQFVPAEGRPLGELRAAAAATNLAGLERWRYVVVTDNVVRLTPAGRQAVEVWRPVEDEVVDRWRTRFGTSAVSALIAALRPSEATLDRRMPPYLPVVGHGFFSAERVRGSWPLPDPWGTPDRAPLTALLSNALLRIAFAFEADSPVSLAIASNHLRVLAEAGGPVTTRDLPALIGTSTEATAMAVGWLERRGMATSGPRGDGGRGTETGITGSGVMAYEHSVVRLARIRDAVSQRDGLRLGSLESALRPFVSEEGQATLLACIRPYSDGWRARQPAPTVLPHFPLVLHRGGYPDGS